MGVVSSAILQHNSKRSRSRSRVDAVPFVTSLPFGYATLQDPVPDIVPFLFIMGLLYLAIKIPQLITMTIFTNIASHLISLLHSTLYYLRIFKSPPDPDDYTSSSSANYVLILDGSSPSLLPVPIHAVTASIKNKVPIIPYSDFADRYGGAQKRMCTVCLDSVEGIHLIRELLNCKHVFHRECLDRWVDEGQVTCPLCRSMLLPPKTLLSSATSTPVM